MDVVNVSMSSLECQKMKSRSTTRRATSLSVGIDVSGTFGGSSVRAAIALPRFIYV